jgi:hypothetical protein
VITDAAAPARSDLRAWPVALLLGSASFLAAYLTMLGGGVGFAPVMLAGAIVVAGGAAVIVALMPRD